MISLSALNMIPLLSGLLGTSIWSGNTLQGPTVRLGNTTIVGRTFEEFGQEFYGGIPFAEPPVGPLRFKPPIRKGELEAGTFDATDWGKQCIQMYNPSLPSYTSEDCLTLNIFRPVGIPEGTKLPVLVWVYGGGFTTGSSREYNGGFLVKHSIARGTPIIYVNLNYRLGVLGFPQGREAASKGALNLGLRDQLAALEWIHQNIGVFGGDKDKVTMFGESAGAVSISSLFFTNDITRLIRGAIFQSGTAGTTFTFDAHRRQNVWTDFVGFVPQCAHLASDPHANTFDCLRNVDSDTILRGFMDQSVVSGELFAWPPTIDGPGGLIPDHPATLFEQGRFAKIPFIAGTNLDEGTVFIPRSVDSSKIIRDWIITNHTASSADIPILRQVANKLLELYPDDPSLGSPYNTGKETFGMSRQFKRLAAILGDLGFDSVRRAWMQAAAKQGVKAYGYLFTDTPPSRNAHGVFHGMDMSYIYPGFFGIHPSGKSEKLSEQMMDYWISFATSLDPNDGRGVGRPHWPQYTEQDEVLMKLHSEDMGVIKDDYRKEQIDFINENGVLLAH